jgi:F420H(2)-dependent quinone reductase
MSIAPASHGSVRAAAPRKCCDTFHVVPNNLGRLVMRAAPVFNAPIAALANSRRFGRLIDRNIAMLTYTGRRSGRTFSIPVGYRRSGGDIVISVNMPEAKTWWRNFLDAGGPLTLRLDGAERAGHAVANRDNKGRVTVTVRLAEAKS